MLSGGYSRLSRWFLAALLVGFSLLALSSGRAGPRPNVLVILADDQGWGDLSLNGNKNLSTPHIDSLAQSGARFERFYVCPVCSPTRAEFLTGRYHPRGGVHSTTAGGERLNLDEKTIGDTFKAAGYATGAFGKWHNGMQYPYHPNGRGFDEFYGFCSGHWGNYFNPLLEHNGKLVHGKGFIIDDLTEHAMAFMERNKDRPFFCYLPYNTPHSPLQVPERFWKKFATKTLEMRHRDPGREEVPFTRAVLAMSENIDWNVGRLLQKLDDLHLSGRTIVLYFSDNGPNSFRWNGGLKGRKGSTDEGGVRSPLLIRWPGQVPAGRVITPIAAAIDLLPTLADLAGIPVVSHKPLDGVSLKPLLLGNPIRWEDRLIFSHWGKKVSVANQRFRLDHQGRLYDLVKDPGQHLDVSDQEPIEAAQLSAAVRRWREDVLAGFDDDRRPFVIGHPDFKYTQIPARDGQPHGQIKRSNHFPNCSYLTHWTELDDSITWDAQVPADGRFEVEIYYACPQTDVGATFELAFNGSNLEGTITEAHDPPLRGMEHDRVKRSESYVKDFRPLRMGTLELKKGRGPLTLRALHIPGHQVMEFRMLVLTRL
jgi:arylsulfatase A-like enzyme